VAVSNLMNYEPRRPRKNRLLWVIGITAGFLAAIFLTLMLMPPLNGSHFSPRLKSATNLSQIGKAISMYCDDNGGVYPDSFQTIFFNEDLPSDVFVSPRTSDTPATGQTPQEISDQLISGGHLSYVYLGRGLSTKTVTPTTVVAYERLIPSSNGTNVLYGDGHVEWVDLATAAKITDTAASGKFPVTMPSN